MPLSRPTNRPMIKKYANDVNDSAVSACIRSSDELINTNEIPSSDSIATTMRIRVNLLIRVKESPEGQSIT
jgi:hypothetical protein